ncbi:MAG: hypothetical protein K5924_02580 [Chloroflexi bacterium]|nr:hypothetical protein [Chloroflexota bacterium]
MRPTRALVSLSLVLLLAGCGGSAPADDGGGDLPASEGAAPAQPGETGGGGGGGEAGSSDDLEAMAERFTPADTTETSRTTAGGVIFLTFESSQSPESLEGFYESAIGNEGFEILNRSSAQGSFSWIFMDPDNDGFGGVVSVTPRADGGGTIVGVQLGSSE